MYAPSKYQLCRESGYVLLTSESEQECIEEMYSLINQDRKNGQGVDENYRIEHLPGEWI